MRFDVGSEELFHQVRDARLKESTAYDQCLALPRRYVEEYSHLVLDPLILKVIVCAARLAELFSYCIELILQLVNLQNGSSARGVVTNVILGTLKAYDSDGDTIVELPSLNCVMNVSPRDSW